MSGIVHGCKSRKMGVPEVDSVIKKEKSVAELYELKEAEERVILIAVRTCEEDDTEACLEELEELVKTAGAVTVDKMIQNRERIHPGTYLGKGKIEEVRERLWELGGTGF